MIVNILYFSLFVLIQLTKHTGGIENEDLELFLTHNIVNRHDFNYIYNPGYEICQNKSVTLLVYGKHHCTNFSD